MFSEKKPLGLGGSIARLQSANPIQQIKSIGNQPRVGVLSPNVIADTGARAISTPSHVQNVRVRVTKVSDITSRVTVTFKRDPNDYFFSHALVHVSGYKGNPAPTQLASGHSPISFALDNTGDPVTVHVQANGNLGPAPLSTAPSATLQLRSTPIATLSTAGGTGITPQAITQIQGSVGVVNPGYFFSAGVGIVPTVYGGTQTSGPVSTTNNQVTAFKFALPFSFQVNKISISCTGAAAGKTANFGIYDSSGNKVLDSGSFSLASTGLKTTTVSVLLPSGIYYFAQSADNSVPSCHAFAVAPTAISNLINLNQTRTLQAGNSTAAGVMPATLGVLTADTVFINMTTVLFET